MGRFAELAFTPKVKAIQERMGSRAAYSRAAQAGQGSDLVGSDEAAFIGERDSCYMASTGEGGWPYIQHRGGPTGFVRVLDERTLGFADYRGNRQYISVGNVMHDDRVALIFVDYPHRARLKVLARAELVTADSNPALLKRLLAPGTGAKVERGFVLHVEALDWNCPQHITPRWTAEEINAELEPLRRRVAELEAENKRLKAGE